MIALILAAAVTLPPGTPMATNGGFAIIGNVINGTPCLNLVERQAMAADAQFDSWIAQDDATKIANVTILQAAGRDTSDIYMGDATPERVRQYAQAAQGIAEALQDLPTCGVEK